MPKIPAPLQKTAVKRGMALLMLVVDNWDKVKIVLRPALDRGLRLLLSRADAQGTLTSEESARMHALERRRKRKVKGQDDVYGWTFEERLEVVMLLEKAYRNNERANWLLQKVEARLLDLLKKTPANSQRTAEFIDAEAVEEDETGARVTMTVEEYERLKRLAGEA